VQTVIDLLRNEETRTQMLEAAKLLDNQLTTFLTLLVQEDLRQHPKGQQAIVITDGQCLP
jgi:hypothetical protein